MRTPSKSLFSRIGLGTALLVFFAAIMLIALVGATTHARRVDSADRRTAAFLEQATAARMDLERELDGVRVSRASVAKPALAAARIADRLSLGHGTALAIRAKTDVYLEAPNGRAQRTAAIRLRTTLGRLIEREQANSLNRSNALSSSLTRTLALGIAGLAGLAVAIVMVGTGLVKAITVPLRRLASDARRLGQGDLSTRVPETGLAEVVDLGASLNAMALSLEHSRSALAAQRDALAASREEAERANAAKSEFLSRMSHELRTPLNAILGFAQLLEFDELNAHQRDNVAHIVSGGRHLLDLINEVLELSRIEAGAISPSIEPVHAATVVHEAIELVGPLANERRIAIELQRGADADLWVAADEQRLKQVLLNLLANAVKYNREEGSVTVTLRRGGGRLRILVTDTGQGIPQDQLPRLFMPFERLGAESTGVEGTGLGLVLALRLMEAMNGTIGVQSQPWIGSTFHVELPLAEEAREQGVVLEPGRPALPLRPIAGGERTVLYIEDDIANTRLMTRLFDEEPRLKLVTTMQGKLGLELARQHQPALILLDLHLPDIEGSEVIRRLRGDVLTRHIPVVMVSADASEETQARLKAAGACRYLTKPLKLERVLATVLEVLDGPAQAPAEPAGVAV
jgi:signal transduction histidine kinase/ActR/RegA family two-component response regulator